jgi:hypothetical protein
MTLVANRCAWALALALLAGPAPAQDVAQLAGAWKFRLTWGGLVNDTGTISARRADGGIEMTCTDGCNTPSFLRARPQGGAMAWEFFAEAGVQSTCKEDKGWRPVQPVVGADGRRIEFWYVMRVSDNCGVLLRGAPAKYVLTKD